MKQSIISLTTAAAVFAGNAASAETSADQCIKNMTNFDTLATQLSDLPGTVEVTLNEGILDQLVQFCEQSTRTTSELKYTVTLKQGNFTLNLKPQ